MHGTTVKKMHTLCLRNEVINTDKEKAENRE